MKRILLAGIAVLALVLAACSGSGSSSGTGPNGKVTLQFWTAQTPPTTQVINSLVNTFHATHPHIFVQAFTGAVKG